jgi:hypothetical protein
MKSRTVNARGLTAAVIRHLENNQGKAYTSSMLQRELNNSQFRAPPTRGAVNSALCRAAKAGDIQRLSLGQYCARDSSVSAGEPERIIDDLLAVMVKAEPVLHRCKRLLAALQSAEVA